MLFIFSGQIQEIEKSENIRNKSSIANENLSLIFSTTAPPHSAILGCLWFDVVDTLMPKTKL